MHELALAQGVIDIVNSEAEKRSFARVIEITLAVGEYSGIVPECIREFFPIAAKGSPAEGASLLIEPIPASFRCADCGYEGAIARREACCPACGSETIKMTSGREFYVESLMVE